MEEEKQLFLNELRKITKNDISKGYHEDQDKIFDWMKKVKKKFYKDNNLVFFLNEMEKAFKQKKLLPEYFYYQVEFVFNGGKF